MGIRKIKNSLPLRRKLLRNFLLRLRSNKLLYKDTLGLFIYSTKTCLRGKTPPHLGHLAPASEVAGGHTLPV
jgi:hypothetical protein